MRLGIAAALVATSTVVVLGQADQAPPALLSRRVAPLASIPIDVERQLWPKKNQTPRPVTGPKEEKGRKYGGRAGKAVVGATFGAIGGFAGGGLGIMASGPAGTAAGTAGGTVSGVYLGTRVGTRGGQKVGGWIGRKADHRDARKAANGGDAAPKKPGFFSRLTDKFRGRKKVAPSNYEGPKLKDQ